MADGEIEARDWFNKILPKVAKKLGKDWKKLHFDLAVPKDSFFLSSVFFVTLKNADDGASSGQGQEVVELVAKRPPPGEKSRIIMQIDSLFHNEILFYEKFSEYMSNCPRWVYLEENPPHDTAIVLENVTIYDFRPYPKTIDTPFEYIVAALKEIARFHSRGYIMKERRRDEFFRILEDLHPNKCMVADKGSTLHGKFVNATAPRSVRYLRKTGYDKEFCDKVESFLEKATVNVMQFAMKPDEPLSTLCHGDFTMNNVLFKKTEQGLQSMLIDYAQISYCTPAVDLSTFLLLYCSSEMRKEKLHDMFKVYHDSLINFLREAGLENLDRFSYEALYEDYKRKALFGFVILTFFLPNIMGFWTGTLEDALDMDPQITAQMNLVLGGDALSKILADVLLELKEFGSLDHVLQQ